MRIYISRPVLFFRREMSCHRRPLREDQVTDAWTVYQYDPAVRSAVACLRTGALGGSITVIDADGVDLPLDRYMRFANSALDWILCIGLVPVTVVHDRAHSYPVVLSAEQVIVSVEEDETGQIKYTGKWRDVRRADLDNIVIWSNTEWPPTLYGAIITNPMVVADMRRPEAHMRKCEMVSQEIRSNPLYVTQERPKERQLAQLGIDDCLRNRQYDEDEEIRDLRRTQNVEIAHQQLREDGRIDLMPTVNLTHPELLASTQPRDWFLPSGRQYVPVQLPASMSDELLRTKQSTDAEIFRIFGLPSSLYQSGHRQAASGDEERRVMTATVRKHAECVQRCINHSLQLVLWARQRHGARPDDRKQAKRPRYGLTPQETRILDELASDSTHSIIQIRGTSFNNADSLLLYEQHGIISKEELVAEIRGICGFSLGAPMRHSDPNRADKASERQGNELHGNEERGNELQGNDPHDNTVPGLLPLTNMSDVTASGTTTSCGTASGATTSGTATESVVPRRRRRRRGGRRGRRSSRTVK